ncbi:MAG: tRNA ((6)-L-threonylcarbamoyladenosine(37)-C(2))-methylthiotransferase MtaB, partial [Bacteroidota bacterium]
SSQRFVPHFHVPLQSGTDKVLGLMKRRYRRDLYTQRVQKIKELMPDACIGADVIVGFPGETDEDFRETYRYLTDLDVSYLHVFSYSERPNTPAAEMEAKVPDTEIAQRSKMLQILSEKKRRHFYEQQLGKEEYVLFESKESGGIVTGFTRNYVKVELPFHSALINTVHKVKLGIINHRGNVLAEFVNP